MRVFLLQAVALIMSAITTRAQQFIAPLEPPETHYVIDATLDPDEGYLTGEGTAVIRNAGAHQIPAIAFQWSGQESAGFELTLAGTTRALQADASPIVLQLPAPLGPGNELTLSFRFRLRVGDLDKGWGQQQWFPRLWWGYPTHASVLGRDAFERLLPLAREEESVWYFAALVWSGMLSDLLGNRELALDSYRQALAVEGDPAMTHSQFRLTIERAWIQQRLQTPFTWP